MGVKFLQCVENVQQGEVFFVQAAYKFLHAAKMHFCIFSWKYFLVSVQNISKNANYEEFLTKLVNTNNHTHNFLHGVIILEDAKNSSQHAKIFEA
jgi:hypothetical protein